MQNYFNYFTEIEERFRQRRGGALLLSTLDWALIEAWREAGIPLDAVLRGMDDAFDRYDARASKARSRLRKVNGLAWCAQSVMEAVESRKDASIGAPSAPGTVVDSGFERARVAAYLVRNASALERAGLRPPAEEALAEIAGKLRAMAADVAREGAEFGTEDLERHLTVLEEKMFAALMLVTDDEESMHLREQAARELSPYRGKMPAAQMKQVTQQFLHKRLLEARGLPRLSLFYMEIA